MINWNDIEVRYIGGITMAKLAEEYGVSERSVQRHAQQGKWREKKKQRGAAVVERALDKAERRQAAQLEKVVSATQKAVDVALAALEDEQQFRRYLVTEEDETREKVFGKLDTRSLKNLTAALKDLTGLMRDFYDLPTPEQAQRRTLARERLELERLRGGTDEAQALTVRFEDTEGAEQ